MENAIANHEFEKARFYSTKNARSARTCAPFAKNTTSMILRRSRWPGGHRGRGQPLDRRPITSIKEEETQKLLRIEEELHKRIISQEKRSAR